MPSSRSRRFSITPVAALTIVALVAMVLISGVGFRASVQGINFEISQSVQRCTRFLRWLLVVEVTSALDTTSRFDDSRPQLLRCRG